MLKYMDDELKEYVYSEYVTVKLSDLIYEYEGRDALKKNFGKMKKLMEYTPAGKEELNYQKLYAALCHFQKKIVTRVVDSDTLNFNEQSLVKNLLFVLFPHHASRLQAQRRQPSSKLHNIFVLLLKSNIAYQWQYLPNSNLLHQLILSCLLHNT